MTHRQRVPAMAVWRESFVYAMPHTGKQKGGEIMKLNEVLRLIAGVFVLGAVVLGATVHPYWNYAAAFVAVNLIQSSFTGWCPMMAMLRRLGVQE